MEEEVSDLNGLNQSLLSELEQMQETYKQDALKNESVLENFEHEMLGNKRDILELSNQLKEVTSKYEQTWAKLQEKEGYIEELEQQLEKVKSRLIHIENTVEEGRRSLEERAELLGARLSAAEKSNEQLEKHEGELEHKITHLINTEDIMGNLIQKLRDENGEITKSLNESEEKNLQISKELENKCTQIHNFNKEIIDLKTNLANYENIIEEYEILKTQLKESQNLHENQIKMLKNRFLESEQCLEGEIQRLLGKVAQLEAERQDFADQYNSLLLERQKLEEELYHIQQTVADVTREDIEQIKCNHKNLAEELNKELEKRQAHIYRIQELEIELTNQKNNSEHFDTQYNEEMLSLKNKLEKELKENELLRYEIVKEKAKKQVEDVVSKAEQTYFTMTSKSDKDDLELTFSLQESTSAPLLSTYPNKSRPEVDEINALKIQISTLDSENQSLKLRLQELDQYCRMPKSNIEADSDDWTAITRDDDDGWGWGSKDAMLEHEHLQKQQIHSELEAKVLEYEQKSFNMEEENKKLNEDLKASQAKCNKLLKKLKEFKNKSDSLERNSREKSVGFDDLDIAMQEELKCQVEKLEKNLKECNSNLNTLQSERTGLLKKIDVLTSGNERLVEMKERQDIEVEMWQRRSNELQNKVQGLEWTLAEMHAEQSEYKDAGKSNLFADEERQHFLKSALEMEEKINILAAENDYLQSLIVELKDKNSNLTISGSKEEVTQQSVEYNDYLHLQQENYRLKNEIKTKEQKQNTEDNFGDYCHEIKKLKKENELLSSEIRNLRQQSTVEINSHDCVNKNEHDDSVVTENEYLKSKITSLEEELVCLKKTCDQLKEDTRKQINQDDPFHVDSPVEGDKDTHNSSGKIASDNETPVLFRGFTSSDSDGIFEMCIGNQVKGNLIANDKILREYPILPSDNHQIVFMDEAKEGAAESLKKVDVDMSKETVNTIEIQELKKTLSERDSEISFLKSSLAQLKEENNDIKKQIEGQSFQNPVPFDLLPGLPSNELLKNNQQWGDEVNDLNKKLEEQDIIIGDLRQKLNIKNNLFDVSQISSDSFNDLFSQAVNSQESQVNYFVEQITLLTKTLHDKEVEIEELNDKKEKYKEMYHTFVKEYDIQSPEHSNSDKEQLSSKNIFMNQLFEDKETELEMMSQQIEQTIVAKENLQDELCLKLSEMEACDKTYTTPKVHEDMLLQPSQPENIEDVRTLCAEVTDLTKLLNEKESEIEILKQQLDEANLEKENLIDEWNKTIEEYKQKYKHAKDKCAHFQHELATLKDSIKADDSKQYIEELLLKNEQLTNALNDLSSVNNLYQDMQRKLNNVETNLKASQMQNNHLTTEVNYLKEIQKSLQDVTQDIEEVNHLNLVQKCEFLKTSYFDTKVKLANLESEVIEKEKKVFALKEKINDLGKTNDFSAESDFDSPIRVKNIKSLSSEPSRISTVTGQSGYESALQLETGQGQMMLLKEIQSLKQVLAMKDSEITKMSIALNDAQENLIRGEMRLINSEETRLKQRLDEALYTLHLRDVRCDELELELMQLLEERDSLQLRLSTAIRFNEELREKYKLLDEAELKLEIEDRAPVDSDENSQQLKQKLDQLHNVGYRRDPTMQQDQQKRYQEQMHLYTHDSSQDESQSSSGFFNWIFGASTSGSQDI